jgi:hypothetical protein
MSANGSWMLLRTAHLVPIVFAVRAVPENALRVSCRQNKNACSCRRACWRTARPAASTTPLARAPAKP